MSNRYPGGIIKATPTAPTTSAASGIWTMPQATQYIKAGTWPVAPSVATDAQYNYVTSLLLGNGTNQVANTTVTDSASTPNTITRSGSPRQTSLTPYSQVDGSVYFDQTAYIYVPDSASVEVGAGDFTIECWAYPTGTQAGSSTLISKNNNSISNSSIPHSRASVCYSCKQSSIYWLRHMDCSCWGYIC